ncbi:hypothetical protein STEG23_016655 [Scotinomys teguina]
MEVIAAAPRRQLLLILLMSVVMLLPGTNGSLLLVQRTVTRTIVLQETIGKEVQKVCIVASRTFTPGSEESPKAKIGVANSDSEEGGCKLLLSFRRYYVVYFMGHLCPSLECTRIFSTKHRRELDLGFELEYKEMED